MLNNRQLSIIKLLKNSGQWMNGSSISNFFGVSARTVRSDIDLINEVEGLTIESSTQYGYRYNPISNENEKKLKKNLPNSTKERIVYTLKNMIIGRRDINIENLCYELGISNATFEKEVSEIREIVEEFGTLEFVRSNRFITLMGEEEDKRRLYKYLLEKETMGNFLNLDKISEHLEKTDLNKISNILNDIIEKYDYKIREAVYHMLILHVAINFERIQSGNYLEIAKDELDCSDKDKIVYVIASEFYSVLSKEFNIDVSENEICYLAYMLHTRKAEGIATIKPLAQFETLISELIATLIDVFDVDFSTDDEFRIGLYNHLAALSLRKDSYNTTNVFLDDIKIQYPLVFEMAVMASRVIEKSLNFKVDENEIGFIALHLGVAYERTLLSNKSKVVLFVPHSPKFSENIEKKIELKYSEKIIVLTINTFQEREILEINPELIITTVPVKHSLNIPTVEISALFNKEDEFRLMNILRKIDLCRRHENFLRNIEEYLDPRFFYTNLELDNPVDVITFMCNDLEQNNFVNKDFLHDVLRRENISSSSFYYSFAVPHSIEVEAKKWNISIAILKKPILWGDFHVRLVFLLAIKSEDRHLYKTFYDWLAYLVDDVDRISKILTCKNYSELIDNLKYTIIT